MNIASLIADQARIHPTKPAIMMAQDKNISSYPFYTFLQLEKRSQKIANRLLRTGVKPGDRVLLFIRPSLDFSVITFALFKLGAVPVFIDPAMGRKNLLRAIKEVSPQGLIAVNQVCLLRWVFRKTFKSIGWVFSVEENLFIAPELLKDIDWENDQFEMHVPHESDTAAILFTSGGTGTPKGVMTTHFILLSQVKMLQEMFHLDESDIDLPGFPLFSLFTLAMGMTSIIPDMDPTKPAQCDPKKIVKTLLEKNVTFAAGSPAIWERVGSYSQTHQLSFPSLKHVVMFGAPVRGEVHELWRDLLPQGTTHAPYGATECLPVASMSGREILAETWPLSQKGAGICVGRPLERNRIFIIKDTDIPKRGLHLCPEGQCGEIAVLGPTVTPGYFQNEKATDLAKIKTHEGLIHRMGDVGYQDELGRIWFCGRKAHVVRVNDRTYYPIPVEAIFNQHPLVRRSALISFRNDVAIVVELKNKPSGVDQFFSELRILAEKFSHTSEIKKFFIHPSFPVDVRHNIKIDRLALSRWAQGLEK